MAKIDIKNRKIYIYIYISKMCVKMNNERLNSLVLQNLQNGLY